MKIEWVIFFLLISFCVGLLIGESHTIDIFDKDIYTHAIKEKAVGFEGKFLYTPKLDPVCIEMIIGKEPRVFPAEECNK